VQNFAKMGKLNKKYKYYSVTIYVFPIYLFFEKNRQLSREKNFLKLFFCRPILTVLLLVGLEAIFKTSFCEILPSSSLDTTTSKIWKKIKIKNSLGTWVGG